jgi:hypothetical protein
MTSNKTLIAVSIAIALGVLGTTSAAEAKHTSHAAGTRAYAAVPGEVPARGTKPYAWTTGREPTYMSVQDQFYHDNLGN